MSTIRAGRRPALPLRRTTLVCLCALAPLAVLLAHVGSTPVELSAPDLSALFADALVLGSAVFVYCHWRTDDLAADRQLTGWLVVGLVLYAGAGLAAAAVTPVTTTPDNAWPLMVQGLTIWAAAVMVHLSRHVEVGRDPALVGAALGAAVSVALILAVTLAPMRLPHAVASGVIVLVIVGSLLVALLLLTRSDVPQAVRCHLSVTVIALTAGRCLATQPHRHPRLEDLAVLGSVVGAISLCAMTQRLLQRTVTRQQREVRSLLGALAEVRAGVREDRELLHEMTSTIAGITTASELIRDAADLPAAHRERLERMLQSELARLGRLSSVRSAPVPCADDVRLDEVIEPVVVSHWLRGRDVRWTPGQVRARVRSDDLAEVVNILLENAARHAPGATVTLDIATVDQHIEISCADDGPGIDASVADRLFESGTRGPDSSGQGLGLAIARRALHRVHGTLELVEQPHQPGARFVARFPRVPGAVSTRDYATS